MLKEDYCKVNGLRLFYRITGKTEPTILFLNGGPGDVLDGSMYLYTAELACRKVYFDQRGCGRSDRAKKESDYTIENFVEDTEELRKKLRLGKCIVFGLSWGGMLGLEYAIKYSSSISKLIVACAPPSAQDVLESELRAKKSLGFSDRRIVDKYTREGFPILKDGSYHPDYLRIVDKAYMPFIRLKNPPKSFYVARIHTRAWNVYRAMLGGGEFEFNIGGTLRNWSTWDRLHKIKCPTLVLAGMHDYCVPEKHVQIANRIPEGRFVPFWNSGHSIYADESGKFLKVVSQFAGAKTY